MQRVETIEENTSTSPALSQRAETFSYRETSLETKLYRGSIVKGNRNARAKEPSDLAKG